MGTGTAKALAFAQGIPLIAVNHIEGHIYANFLAHRDIEPPLVCLTVSGGHTDLLYIEDYGAYRILGRTRDDAAGEAFDKVGRVLGLPYPAGREIDALAQRGDPTRYPLPQAMLGDDTYDFSFSGLKTAAINLIHNEEQRGRTVDVADFAASLQEAIVSVLAARPAGGPGKGVDTILLSGGVGQQRLAAAPCPARCSAGYQGILSTAGAVYRQCRDDWLCRILSLSAGRLCLLGP